MTKKPLKNNSNIILNNVSTFAQTGLYKSLNAGRIKSDFQDMDSKIFDKN
jgi:hypothetical protein